MGVCCLCVCVFKLLLNLLNTVILLAGLVITGVGGVCLGLASNGTFANILQGIIFQILSGLNMADQNALSKVSSDFADVLQPAGIALVITGGIIAGIALIGYCGTSISIILKLYLVILTILIVAESVAIALFFSGVFNPYIRQGANESLVKYYVDINDGGIHSMVWNIVMIEVKCCGLDDYTDFHAMEKNPWPKNKTISIGGTPATYEEQTPLSCCKMNGSYPSYQLMDDLCSVNPTNNISNWNTGCWKAVSTELTPYRTPAIIICSLIIVVQAVIAVMAYIIIRDSSDSSGGGGDKAASA